MKKLTTLLLGLLLLGVMRPSIANVADVDWLGRISALGGAESEVWRRKEGALNGSAHPVGQFEGLGVIPFLPFAGLQLSGGVGGGDSVRVHFQGGPIFGFGFGKAGVFWGTQFRRYADGQTDDGGRVTRDAWTNWVRPAMAFYLPGANIDIWYSQPIGGATRLGVNNADHAGKRIIGLSEGRVALNWFPPFIMNENVELTLGAHVTGMTGADNRQKGVPMGVGPVAGMAFMPWQNLEVQLFKAQFDNRNRYRVTSGLQFYFNQGNATLLALRRKYLEPTGLPGTVTSDSGDR